MLYLYPAIFEVMFPMFPEQLPQVALKILLHSSWESFGCRRNPKIQAARALQHARRQSSEELTASNRRLEIEAGEGKQKQNALSVTFPVTTFILFYFIFILAALC